MNTTARERGSGAGVNVAREQRSGAGVDVSREELVAGVGAPTAENAPRIDRLAWRDWLAVLTAAQGVAVALWLVPASVHIVAWQRSAAVRVALFASMQRLALLTLAAAALAIAYGWLVPRIAAHTGRCSRAFTAAFTPLLLLWSWTIPFLPWLPDRAPLLLVLAGPVRWFLAAAVVLVAATRARRLLTENGGSSPAKPAGFWCWRRSRRAVFVTSLATYLAFGLYNAHANGPRSDEPHYLIIAESLLRDGDLRIENNHRRGDFRSFFSGELKPDYLRRGKDGQIYSIHAPGLPALLLPVYAVAGYAGSVAILCLMASLAAVAIFDLATVVAGPTAAVWTWIAVCLTVPMIPQAWLIFPETPAALIVASTVLWIARPLTVSTRRWMTRGLGLAILPWLHTKFAVLLPLLVVPLLVRAADRGSEGRPEHDRQWRRVIALSSPIAASCALWLYSFYAIYGTADPQAPYGVFTRDSIATRLVPHGLVGLLFDSKFGLLAYSPIYALACAGGWLMLRDRKMRWPALAYASTTVAFAAITARFYMFWGGASAPARFLVPVVPCVAPMVAVTFCRLRGAAARGIQAVLLGCSLGVAALALTSARHAMLFSDPHGLSRTLEWMQGSSPLALLAPTFTEPNWTASIGRLTVCLGAAAAALAAAALGGRRRNATALQTAAAGCATFLLIVGVASGRASDATREATARRGAAGLLSAADPGVLRPFEYANGRAPTPSRLRELTTLHLSVRRAESLAATDGAVLPPGKYDALIWFDDSRQRQGEIIVSEGRRAAMGKVDGPLSNPAHVPFELPVPAGRLAIRLPDRQLGAGLADAWIVPVAVAPRSARPDMPVRVIESIAGRGDAFVIYADDSAYPEGGAFWTHGTAAAHILVAPGSASRMILTLSTGARKGMVRITVLGGARSVATEANESSDTIVDLPRGMPLVSFTVQSDGTMWPADHDPASSDMRALGCHVLIRLD